MLMFSMLHKKEMPKPEFFVVGHPRCGSEVVDMAPSAHPDVFMAPKDLHFFGSDLEYNRPEWNSERCLVHFSGLRLPNELRRRLSQDLHGSQ